MLPDNLNKKKHKMQRQKIDKFGVMNTMNEQPFIVDFFTIPLILQTLLDLEYL